MRMLQANLDVAVLQDITSAAKAKEVHPFAVQETILSVPVDIILHAAENHLHACLRQFNDLYSKSSLQRRPTLAVPPPPPPRPNA